MNNYLALKNKITNKLWGTAYLPAANKFGKKKGTVLLSYFTEPFTYLSKEEFPVLHTNYWECFEIARLFSIRGYDVDIINWNDTQFIPTKKYIACIDIQQNLERLAPYLPQSSKKIMHIVSAYWKFQNDAEEKRLHDLFIRRGIKLSARRHVDPSRNPQYADMLEGFGNNTIHATYAKFNKKIYPIPISSVTSYEFPENKNIDLTKKNFLFLSGGGMVHKGLDLLLETFSKLPNIHLHICGPVNAEKDFTETYHHELFNTPNIHTYGRIDVTSDKFKETILKCSSIIYPSCSEGTSGAVVQAMHAGLIPIITPETGVIENDYSFMISNPTIESITSAVKKFNELPDDKIKELSLQNWQLARSTYTREKFSETYSNFIDSIDL